MTRRSHSLALTDRQLNEAVQSLAVHHISAIKRGARGAIISVKHVQFGWISPSTYYQLQQLGHLKPFIVEVIKGGYILKAAIWTVAIPLDVLASGTSVPLGVIVMIIAVGLAAFDYATGDHVASYLDLAALVLPYGELWLLYRGGLDLWKIGGALGTALQTTLPSGLTLKDAINLALPFGIGNLLKGLGL